MQWKHPLLCLRMLMQQQPCIESCYVDYTHHLEHLGHLGHLFLHLVMDRNAKLKE